jgi:predicted transcriptional regulator
MKKTVRTLGITAALAVMIPFSAYAATNMGSASDEKIEISAGSGAKSELHEGRGGFGRQKSGVSQEVLDLLKLDKAAFQVKVEAGATLAEIAAEQGVTRDNLKSVMTEAFNKKQEEQKAEFTTNLDKVLDAELQSAVKGGRDGGFRRVQDFTAAAGLLGLTVDEVKEQLRANKSLADLAEEKGVDVQKLVDAQIAATTASINQAVADGKLTQEQADKKLANVAEQAEKAVNGKGIDRGHPGGGGGKDRGFGGQKPAESEAAEASPTPSSAT